MSRVAYKQFANPPQTEQRRRVCPKCGREFFAKGIHHYTWKRERFCSEECKALWTDSEARRLLDAGKSLVDISDVIKCNLCGATLKVVGTHFTRYHGLASLGRSKLLKQLAFGLNQGDRLATEEYRLNASQTARKLHELGLLPPLPPGNAAKGAAVTKSDQHRKLLATVPHSDAQEAACRVSIQEAKMAQHIRGCVVKACLECGREFQSLKNRSRKFCSQACDIAHRRPGVCEFCGIEFLMKKGKRTRCCSAWCKSRLRSKAPS